MSPTDWQTLREQIDQLEAEQNSGKYQKVKNMLVENNIRLGHVPSVAP